MSAEVGGMLLKRSVLPVSLSRLRSKHAERSLRNIPDLFAV